MKLRFSIIIILSALNYSCRPSIYLEEPTLYTQKPVIDLIGEKHPYINFELKNNIMQLSDIIQKQNNTEILLRREIDKLKKELKELESDKMNMVITNKIDKLQSDLHKITNKE